MTTVSIHNPLKHYRWGSGCDGWTLVDSPSLSIKQERMPPDTAEEMHCHHIAQQFFFILKGIARLEVNGTLMILKAGEGLHINPLEKHRIVNTNLEDLEFILCSSPSTTNDRFNVP